MTVHEAVCHAATVDTNQEFGWLPATRTVGRLQARLQSTDDGICPPWLHERSACINAHISKLPVNFDHGLAETGCKQAHLG